jgi:penicillin-binding protein 1A
VPDGVVAAHINPETGLRDPEDKQGLIEYFYHENLPPEGEPLPDSDVPVGNSRPDEVKSELY